ncbi:MAG TPA: M28 family peptidase, partial [Pirellulales bacterium]|nr:M28 family peptidase [Pirellulales bacterium]
KPQSLTYTKTAKRSFEVAYWRMIAELATGQYVNKDNADCVLDPQTLEHLAHEHRDLEALGDHILEYYDRVIAEQKMAGKALAGEFPFTWRTDFDYDWMGGWKRNQAGETQERDLVCLIPGRDRRQAVIMGDHYDTAYMEDRYGYMHGGKGPRLAAAGADDNHSATATLMLAAPILMELSRAGQLACDVWLVHLTGEEFPADCLGARHLCERLVEGNLQIRLTNGRERDLSKVRIRGLYVLDMVAHNNDREPDVFQICPGASRESMWLAYQAHLANAAWNDSAPQWNSRAGRKNCRRGKRSADPAKIPEVALHPQLSGEVRPAYDPRSTLFNTDGQIFSDAGVPVVLFMENYDINRQGYHDSHDTMENIDLDYGAAVAAIAIESVARAATEAMPW